MIPDGARRVRDPSTGEEYEVQERRPEPSAAAVRPSAAGAAAVPLANAGGPLRLVVVDGVIRGEARSTSEVAEILKAHGLDPVAIARAVLSCQQLPDRYVVKTDAKAPRR